MGEPYSVRTESQWESYHHHHYYFINLRGLKDVGSKVDNSVAREMVAKEKGFMLVTAPCFIRRWCPWVISDELRKHQMGRPKSKIPEKPPWRLIPSWEARGKLPEVGSGPSYPAGASQPWKSWEGHVLSHRKASTGVVMNLLHVLPVVCWIVELFSVVFVTLRTRAFLIGNRVRCVRCQTAVEERLC